MAMLLEHRLVQIHGMLLAWCGENYTILPDGKGMIQFYSLGVPRGCFCLAHTHTQRAGYSNRLVALDQAQTKGKNSGWLSSD